MGITLWPGGERPRTRLIERGLDGLSDAELLALVLRSGQGKLDAVALGRSLLARFGSLQDLLAADFNRLLQAPGLGPAKAAALRAVVGLSERCLEQTVRASLAFAGSADVSRFVRQRLGCRGREVFAVLLLDSQHRLIEYRELFLGTLDAAVVHPREVLKSVMEVNAAAVIFAHNHPSGVAEPSRADVALTERLKSVLALVDVRVLDHIVVSRGAVVSMAERGLL
ncbi:MAG: DNA repair protein RadC [Gammaproteobacteria bacterium]|nr:DNA repair protein RadC [Gammaproteobacteria bacterium]